MRPKRLVAALVAIALVTAAVAFPPRTLWRLHAMAGLALGNFRARALFCPPLEVRVAGVAVGHALRLEGSFWVPLREVASSLGWQVHWEPGTDVLELSRHGSRLEVPIHCVLGTGYVPLEELERVLGLPPPRLEHGVLELAAPPREGLGADGHVAMELRVEGGLLSRRAFLLPDGRTLVPAIPLGLALAVTLTLHAVEGEVEANGRRLPFVPHKGAALVELGDFLAAAGLEEPVVRLASSGSGPTLSPPPPVGHVSGARGRVALTFDDYLTPGVAELLDILEDRGVRATFFVIGSSVEQHAGLARRIVEGGSELANHTWSHRHPFALTEDELRAEILATALVIRRHVGSCAPFFRPPGGYWDRLTLSVAADLGLTTVLWSLNGQDADPGADPGRIAATVLRRAHDGAVVVLHLDRPATVAALPAIIDGLRARGLEPVPLGELLPRIDVLEVATWAPASPPSCFWSTIAASGAWRSRNWKLPTLWWQPGPAAWPTTWPVRPAPNAASTGHTGTVSSGYGGSGSGGQRSQLPGFR